LSGKEQYALTLKTNAQNLLATVNCVVLDVGGVVLMSTYDVDGDLLNGVLLDIVVVMAAKVIAVSITMHATNGWSSK